MGAVLATARPIAAAEDAVARWFGRERALLVGSGTAAITLLLEALGLPRNSKVLYPDTICDTAVNAAVCAGLEPAFADVEVGDGHSRCRIGGGGHGQNRRGHAHAYLRPSG